MRVMVIVKSTPTSEQHAVPAEKTREMMAEMGRYNDELARAGVLVTAEGLFPSSEGKRVVLGRARKTVIDGPFTESKELVAGFWIWKVASMEEAVEWARRCPQPMPGEEGQLELRRIHEQEDIERFTHG